MSGTNIAKPFSLRLPKTEKGMRNLRRVKSALQWVVLFAFVLIGFLGVKFLSPLSIQDGAVIFSAFLINLGFYAFIELTMDFSPVSKYSIDAYTYFCKRYPELLAYHQTLKREPVQAELDAFYKFNRRVEREKGQEIGDAELEEAKRKLEMLKTPCTGIFAMNDKGLNGTTGKGKTFFPVKTNNTGNELINTLRVARKYGFRLVYALDGDDIKSNAIKMVEDSITGCPEVDAERIADQLIPNIKVVDDKSLLS